MVGQVAVTQSPVKIGYYTVKAKEFDAMAQELINDAHKIGA